MTSRSSTAARSTRRRRRPLVRLLVVLLVVFALLVAAAAWYFSGRIGVDALSVRDYPPRLVEVAAADDASITLDDSAERHEPVHDDLLYGLVWDDGFGTISGPPATDDEGTRRDFTVTRGTPPSPGDDVDLVRDLVDDEDPDSLVVMDDVMFEGPDGPLAAELAEGDSSTWMVLVHGKGASPDEMKRMAQAGIAAGLPTMAITYRNDEGAPADPDGRYGFGRTEWPDLEAAVDYAVAHGAEHVVLGGASMGGGIVAAYLENAEPADGLVTGVVLDAPMLDLGATVEFGAEQLELPLGLSVPGPLTWAAQQVAAARYDVDWGAVDYLDDTSWLTVPALVFHCRDDLTVPVGTSEALADAEPDRVRLVLADGGHVEAYNADPGTYLAELAGFLSEVA